MIQVTTAAGEKSSLPPSVIKAVMKPSDGSGPSSIIIHVNGMARVQPLADQYGYVKKLLIDSMIMVNPIEVTTVEVAGEGLMFFSRENIIGWSEVKNQPPTNASIYVDLFGSPVMQNIKETVDELHLEFTQPSPSGCVVLENEPGFPGNDAPDFTEEAIEETHRIEAEEEEQAAFAADALDFDPNATAPETTVPPAPEF